MIYRQKIGMGFSTQSPSRLLSKCRHDQQDGQHGGVRSVSFPRPVRLVYYQQDNMAMSGLCFFLNIDMSRLT